MTEKEFRGILDSTFESFFVGFETPKSVVKNPKVKEAIASCQTPAITKEDFDETLRSTFNNFFGSSLNSYMKK